MDWTVLIGKTVSDVEIEILTDEKNPDLVIGRYLTSITLDDGTIIEADRNDKRALLRIV
jgi:hypothetical protein